MQHQQDSTSGPPSSNSNQSSTNHHSKPFYKNKNSGTAGGNYKKGYHTNNYGGTGGGGHSTYHGQSYYMKSRDRNTSSTSSANSYDNYNNYAKVYGSGTNNTGNSTYDTYNKNKQELGSTGSLTGNNCANTNNMPKSNIGPNPGGPQSKGHHQASNWSHMNQFKNSRRNNYGNYTNYDSIRNQNNSKYDSIGNSSGHSSNTSSTPATNVSPTSKSSTPEEYDHAEQSSCEPNSLLNIEPNTDTGGTSSNVQTDQLATSNTDSSANEPDSTVNCIAREDSSQNLSVDASLNKDLKALTITDEDTQKIEVDSEKADLVSPTTFVESSSTNTSSSTVISTSTSSNQNSKLSPNVTSTATVGRQSKHNYNTHSGSAVNYHQSNYYGKPNASQGYYHNYGYGRGGKKGQHNQTGYYAGPNVHPSASIKNANTSTYFSGVPNRAIHNKQSHSYSGAPLPAQYSAMHHLAANQMSLTGQTGHHPNSQAYMDNNMAAAAAGFISPYGVPAHLLPFYSMMPGSQASLAQPTAHHSSQTIHQIQPISQSPALNMPTVPAAGSMHHPPHLLPQHASQQVNLVATGSVGSAASASSNNHLQHHNHHSHHHNSSQPTVGPQNSNSQPPSGNSSEAMVTNNNCGDCCTGNPAAGYYGGPVLNYSPGMPFNYPFASAPLVSLQPYATFGGAKIPPNFIPHAMGPPVNYLDMNYMSFVAPNAYSGMIPAGSGESQLHATLNQMQTGAQQIIPTMVQSPPPVANTGSNGSTSATCNDYSDLSRPGSTYDPQVMENNAAAYSTGMAGSAAVGYQTMPTADPTKSYPLLGYMPTPAANAGALHPMQPTGGEFVQMTSWTNDSAPASCHASTGPGSAATSQNFSADPMLYANYQVGPNCDNNGTASDVMDK